MGGDTRAVMTIESLLESGAITAHKDGNYGSQYPRVEEFGSVGIPFLTAKSLNDGKIDIDGAPRLSEERANELRFGFVQPGDVLLSHNATIGRVAVVPKFEGRLLVGTSLTYFRVDPTKISPRYLAAYFCGSDFQNQLAAVMSLSTRNQVPITAQRHLRVVLPPLTEQNAIAHTLGTLDDKIELNRRMNETLEAIGRGIFRFEMEGVDTFQEGKFSRIATISRDSVDPSVSPTEVFDHYSIPAYDATKLPVIERGIDIKSNKFIVYPDSVLLSKLNPRIPRIWMPNIGVERRSICSTEFLVLRPTPVSSREFIYGFCSSPEFRGRFATMVTGTSGSHQRVQPEYIEQMEMRLPPSEIVKKYTDTVAPIHERCVNNLAEARTLAVLRDALLPGLISGKLCIRKQGGL